MSFNHSISVPPILFTAIRKAQAVVLDNNGDQGSGTNGRYSSVDFLCFNLIYISDMN